MSVQGKSNVETTKIKVYESLDQWKSDFLPNKVRSEHLSNLSRSEKSMSTINQAVTIIESGTLTVRRHFF